MDDEIQLLQSKLQSVSECLANFTFNKQNAEYLLNEYQQLLAILNKYSPTN
ncbi:hypothetical protein [Alteromonas sp. V450]|uniref:hypothetical protein n=1 Tax=Alteromonas sp. V450 TaxID=1912139 RepID=UPI000B1770D7|nr:hypothetical protein [Alteromonas sp. V450]